MRTILLIVIFLIYVQIGQAQNNSEILTNKAVIELYKLELGESIIITKIQTSHTDFDVSVDGLIELKGHGISEKVINAMMESALAQADLNADPNDPTSPHPPGIYYFDPDDSTLKLLEPTVYSQTKDKGRLATAFSYGLAKTKLISTLDGAQAVFRIGNTQPEFYFYFEETSSGLGNTSEWYFVQATSPNEFALVKLDVKKSSREMVVGSSNVVGSQTGVDEKHKVSFKYQKIGPGIYRVYFDAIVAEGEYCFVYAGSAPYGGSGIPTLKAFDFGIK